MNDRERITIDPDIWRIIRNWNEKILSPKEIADFADTNNTDLFGVFRAVGREFHPEIQDIAAASCPIRY
ncbi:MAG: hypothetical protein IPH12_07650 [Saprospirales bacterium]|nr:hypothetical protein [Saprospirales bacterium]